MHRYLAYLDASGTQADHKVYSVSGFIAEESGWNAFRGDWKVELAKRGVTQFHMTDLESGYGEFRGWERQERESLLQVVLDIVERHTLASVSYAVSHEMYGKYVSQEVNATVGGSPYWFLFLNAVLTTEYMMHAAARFGVPGFRQDWEMAYELASGDLGAGALAQAFQERSRATAEMWRATRTVDIAQARDNSDAPLGAADLLAFEARKQTEVQLGLAGRKPRYPFRVLEASRHPRGWQFYQRPMHLIQNADLVERAVLGKGIERLLTWES